MTRPDARPLVAVDPGLDGIGVALFRPGPERERSMGDALKRLVYGDQVPTSTDDALIDRVGVLTAAVADRCAMTLGKVTLIIECPPYEGDYKRSTKGAPRRSRRDLNRLYLSIGALAGAGLEADLDVASVHLVIADSERKKDRQALLRANARVVGVELPYGPRGGIQADAWDAIWLGCRWLIGPVRELES